SVARLGRYSVVVMNAWQTRLVSPAQVRAESPGTKVLMYAAGPDVSIDCTTFDCEQNASGSGVTMYDVDDGHPEWLLKDASGSPIHNAGYPFYYEGDIGSATFRERWIANVVERAKRLGFDGVSIDDIL